MQELDETLERLETIQEEDEQAFREEDLVALDNHFASLDLVDYTAKKAAEKSGATGQCPMGFA